MNTHIRSLSDEVRLSDRGLAFIGAIVKAQAWDADLIQSFLEKPWHWDDEFALWLNNDAPTDFRDPAFGRWVELMHAP